MNMGYGESCALIRPQQVFIILLDEIEEGDIGLRVLLLCGLNCRPEKSFIKTVSFGHGKALLRYMLLFTLHMSHI